jgi:predicted nucleic acid-binding protein
MSKIITNSTPIIGLSIIGKIDLLSDMFDEVFVPEAVYKEIVFSDSVNDHGKTELKNAIDNGEILLRKIENSHLIHKLYGKLHEGELEVIVGAKELNIEIVAIDEKAARSLAKTFQLRPIGTVGILIIAKGRGLIREVRPLLDKLLEYNFYMTKTLYHHALKLANE